MCKIPTHPSTFFPVDLGEAFYNDAVLPFYKAIKVYPAPKELINIYQQTLPQPVFETVINILAIEVSDTCVREINRH
jgi:import receptor subunit TOM20